MLGAALNRHLGVEMIFQTLLDGGTNPRIGLGRLGLLRLLPRRNLHGDDFFGAAYRKTFRNNTRSQLVHFLRIAQAQ